MKVTCSVVSGADNEQLPAFLRTLRESVAGSAIDLEVHAVINGPVSALAERAARWADEVIVNAVPRGFAANHNDVLRKTTSVFHLIANDDVRVPTGCVQALLEHMTSTAGSHVGAISPVLRNVDGSLQPSTYSFPTLATSVASMTGIRDQVPDWIMRGVALLVRRRRGSSRLWAHDQTVDVDTLRGAFVLVRRAAVDQVGLMSEVALVGGEEVEWHKRFQLGGWTVRLLASAHVTHIGRVSTGGRADLEVEYLKGTVNFFAQHRSRTQFLIVIMIARVKTHFIRAQEARAGRDLLMHLRPLNEMEYRQTP